MSEINEKETWEYFLKGAAKAKSAARELAALNERGDWIKVRSALGQIERTALKIYTDKPQTRLQTLALANKIQDGIDAASPGTPKIIH